MSGTKTEDHVVLESAYIELDPILDGFEGVFIELSCRGSDYILTETAVATGNSLLKFSSTDAAVAYGLFCRETGPKNN